MIRKSLKLASLIALGLLVPLGLFEAALRAAGVGGPADLDPTFDRPSDAYSPHGDRQNPWTREAEEVLRVAVIGDSFSAGFGNQWHDGYPLRLEQLLNLNAETVPAEVRVFAKNGTSTFAQLRFLDQSIEYGADLIVLGLFINDTEDMADEKLDPLRQDALPRVPTGWKRQVLRSSRALARVYLRFENVRRYRAVLAYQEYVLDPQYSGWKRFRCDRPGVSARA